MERAEGGPAKGMFTESGGDIGGGLRWIWKGIPAVVYLANIYYAPQRCYSYLPVDVCHNMSFVVQRSISNGYCNGGAGDGIRLVLVLVWVFGASIDGWNS